MAKVTYNPSIAQIRGAVDRLVFRHLYGQAVVGPLRERRKRARSTAEQATVDRFRAAALWAKHVPPSMQARYLERAREENKPAYAVRIRDYLNPPEIESVNLAGYHGQPGECILVRARDDFEVKNISVRLRMTNGAVLESGPARHVGGDVFRYDTTCAPGAGAEVAVEIEVTDHANNVTKRTCPWVIAPH